MVVVRRAPLGERFEEWHWRPAAERSAAVPRSAAAGFAVAEGCVLVRDSSGAVRRVARVPAEQQRARVPAERPPAGCRPGPRWTAWPCTGAEPLGPGALRRDAVRHGDQHRKASKCGRRGCRAEGNALHKTLPGHYPVSATTLPIMTASIAPEFSVLAILLRRACPPRATRCPGSTPATSTSGRTAP